MKEIFELGITFIESFEVKRKPYNQFKSIYIVRPSQDNFDRIAQDFELNPLYKELNIYLTEPLDEQMLQLIKRQKFKSKI